MKFLTIYDYQMPIVACGSLLLGMIGYWISLALPKNFLSFKVSKVLVIVSNIIFALTLFLRWVGEGYFPLSNLYESLIFLCWGISTIQIIIEQQTQSRLIGAIGTPILFFLAGFSSLTLPTDMQKALPLVPSLQSNWLMMHVTMMMISYATLIVGSLLSILYLTFVTFNKPNSVTSNVSQGSTEALTLSESKTALLQTVDTWSYRIIGLGFPFLTIGIISGAVWANEAWGSYWSWDPKETWALITWLVFAIYLHSRLLKGWQGKQTAILGTCGFFVIWICYLGVNFLGRGLHSYGWVL